MFYGGLTATGLLSRELSDYWIFIPFRYYHNFRSSLPVKKYNNEVLIFTLNMRQDVEALIEFSRSNFKLSNTEILLSNFCCFLDECRWRNRPCPADKLTRAIINSKGYISPCFYGLEIGRLGDSSVELIERLTLLKNKILKKRGCEKCIIRDKCSKCFFPYPLSDEEFCLLRKRYEYIGRFMDLVKTIRRTKVYYDFSSVKSSDNTVVKFEQNLAIFKTAKRSLLYDFEKESLWIEDK
jgi:hypothetical protein